ncbi:MAG: hypothetical protein HDT22_00755 [Ruminococcus sp.]|nr:hypothetical protein [Ruminococcus sp.]
MNNYKSKNNIKNIVKASSSALENGQYEITLTDEKETVLDIYIINPVTGIGTNSKNEEINLPQTGNNSLKNLLISINALLATGFGYEKIRNSP